MVEAGSSLASRSLEFCVCRLAEGLERCRGALEDELLRDGLIQRFEHVYDASVQAIGWALRDGAASPDDVDRRELRDLLRAASLHGLVLDGWPGWRRYRDARGRTLEAYVATIAEDVAGVIPALLEDVEFLRDELGRLSS